MERRITQRDVARQAGVHRTTVSLALRNHPSIPLPTRLRIQTLAESMRYRPDPNLSALMVYRSSMLRRTATSTLGYVTHWDSRDGWRNAPAHAQFHAGAAAKAAELGYNLEHFSLAERDMSHARLSNILVARGVRGLIVASHTEEHHQPIAFDWARFSAVKIDLVPPLPALNVVTNDQRSMMQMAMRRILALGYRRIGFVLPETWDQRVDLAWSAGFLAMQARLDPADRVPLLCHSKTASAGDDDAALRVDPDALLAWIDAHQPDVVLGYGPYLLPQLALLGMRVPDDLAFADIFLDSCDGRIAGIRQNCHRVGEVAAELVASQLALNVTGIPQTPTATLVEGTWCDGASLPCRHGAALPAFASCGHAEIS